MSVHASGNSERPVPAQELALAQLDKILVTPAFVGSENLRKLLSFLVARAIEDPERAIKEHEIATEVLGRDASFDPRIDSVVRVQIGRLRSKLAEYYLAEGANDDIILELPRGAYHLAYHWRQPATRFSTEQVQPEIAAQDRRSPGLGVYLNWLVPVALVVASISVYLGVRTRPNTVPAHVQPAADPLPATSRFWSHFIGMPDPVIFYSNPKFTGSPFTSLRPFKADSDSASEGVNVYTGVGEIQAVHDITECLYHFKRRVRLVRAGLLAWDQARDRNLVFLGAPHENAILNGLAPLSEFNFRLDAAARGSSKRVVIVDEHPAPQSPAVYYAEGHPAVTQDYAVLALVSGFRPNRRALILACTTTYGTQAAAEFVCDEHSLAELLLRLGAGKSAAVPDFEALLSVQIEDEFPISSKLLFVRLRKAR